MPATVTLAANGHVLHYVFHDPVTFADIKGVEQEADVLYDKANFRLHSLINVSDVHKLPEGFLKLRNTKGLTHANAGHTAILGASIYIQVMAETILRLARNSQTRFFTSDREADGWAFLQEIITSEQTTQHGETIANSIVAR